MDRPTPLTEQDERKSSKNLDLGWTKVHYNEWGAGEPLVLLHGGGLGASSWGNYILNIGAFAKHFRVIALDCPGYGKSAPWLPKDEDRNTGNARAVKGVVDALGLKKIHLVGNSMGGATSLTFAVDYPENTGKIITMGCQPVGQRDPFTPRQPTHGIETLMSLLTNPSYENFRKVFDLMLYDSSLVPDEVLKARAQNINEAHRANMEASWKSRPIRRNLVADLEKVQNRVLLIHGANDSMTAPGASLLLLPYLKNAELHIFNNCGHWAQYEHPGKFNRMVLDFLMHDG